MRDSARRPAFTLVEIVVIFAILAILIALLIPAVQRVRMSMARSQCANNMKQLAVAIFSYHEAKKFYPPSVGFSDMAVVRGNAGPMGPDKFPNPPGPSYVSWIRAVGPYMEFNKMTADLALPQVTCPADPRAGNLVGTVDLHGYTCYLAVCGLDNYATDGVLFKEGRVSAANVLDGVSNTLLLVERPPAMMGNDWGWGWWEAYDPGHVSLGMQVTNNFLSPASAAACGSPVTFGPGASNADYTSFTGDPDFCHANHAWSFHESGSNVLFADGRVMFLTYRAGSTVMAALATRSGGESVTIKQKN